MNGAVKRKLTSIFDVKQVETVTEMSTNPEFVEIGQVTKEKNAIAKPFYDALFNQSFTRPMCFACR